MKSAKKKKEKEKKAIIWSVEMNDGPAYLKALNSEDQIFVQ